MCCHHCQQLHPQNGESVLGVHIGYWKCLSLTLHFFPFVWSVFVGIVVNYAVTMLIKYSACSCSWLLVNRRGAGWSKPWGSGSSSFSIKDGGFFGVLLVICCWMGGCCACGFHIWMGGSLAFVAVGVGGRWVRAGMTVFVSVGSSPRRIMRRD